MRNLRLMGYVCASALRSVRAGWKLHLLTAGTVTAIFLVFGGGLLLFQNVRAIFLGSAGETELTVHFRDGKEDEGRGAVETGFCREPFVRRCTFLSRAEAREIFVRSNPDLASAVSALEENPFPASIRLEVDPEFRDADRLRSFSGRLAALPAVEGVEEGGEWLVTWVRLLDLIDLFFLSVMTALGAVVIFVVSSTIRILVHARREEVEILRLVGATDAFIRAPVLLEGASLGFVGVLAALGILRLLFAEGVSFAAARFGGLLPSDFVFLPLRVQFAALGAGTLLGLVGGGVAVGRFLRS